MDNKSRILPWAQVFSGIVLIGVTCGLVYYTRELAKRTGVTELPNTERPYVEYYLEKKDSKGNISGDIMQPPKLTEVELEEEDIDLLLVFQNSYRTPAKEITLSIQPNFVEKGGQEHPGDKVDIGAVITQLGSFQTKRFSLMPLLKHHILSQKLTKERKEKAKLQVSTLNLWITYRNGFTSKKYDDPYGKEEGITYQITSQ